MNWSIYWLRPGKIWIQTHFNHPVEITPETERACRNLVNAGMPVNNHSVLMKGVNDSVPIMRDLIRGLLRIKVRPYYLFHCDPVTGAGHFRTSIWKGMEIIEGLRGHVSGLGIPTYVVDGLHGAGKIPVMPNYMLSASDDAVVLRNYEGMIFRYAPEDKHAPAKPIVSDGVSGVLSGEAKPLMPETSPRMARRRKFAAEKAAAATPVVATIAPLVAINGANGNGKNGNGHANGKTNGHATNGHAAKSNGKANGKSNGHAAAMAIGNAADQSTGQNGQSDLPTNGHNGNGQCCKRQAVGPSRRCIWTCQRHAEGKPSAPSRQSTERSWQRSKDAEPSDEERRITAEQSPAVYTQSPPGHPPGGFCFSPPVQRTGHADITLSPGMADKRTAIEKTAGPSLGLAHRSPRRQHRGACTPQERLIG